MAGWASNIGRALRGVRHSLEAAAGERLACPNTLTLTSSAFDDGGTLPVRFTADGQGLSPPLAWSGIPQHTAALALLVEDVDVPVPRPIVHLLLHAIPPSLQSLAEGAVALDVGEAPPKSFQVGRNTLARRGWRPPSPIPGHGPHRYVFQVFALDQPLPARRIPGRGALLVWARRHAIGQGRMVGVYQRP